MSAARWVLHTLSAIGIEVGANGDELVLRGNVDELREADWTEIRELKRDLLDELRLWGSGA